MRKLEGQRQRRAISGATRAELELAWAVLRALRGVGGRTRAWAVCQWLVLDYGRQFAQLMQARAELLGVLERRCVARSFPVVVYRCDVCQRLEAFELEHTRPSFAKAVRFGCEAYGVSDCKGWFRFERWGALHDLLELGARRRRLALERELQRWGQP